MYSYSHIIYLGCYSRWEQWRDEDVFRLQQLHASKSKILICLSRPILKYELISFMCIFRHNIASALRFEYLLKPNDTVALFSPNNIDYLPICLAVAMCGSKLTPLNPLYTVQEMTTVLDRSSSKILFTHAKLLPVALEASAKSKSVEHIVVIPDPEKDCDLPSGAVDLAMLSGYKHSPNLEASVDEVHHHVKDVNNHPWLLPYSSGTTGLPKGVCLSHGNMIANLLQLDEVEGTAFPMVRD